MKRRLNVFEESSSEDEVETVKVSTKKKILKIPSIDVSSKNIEPEEVEDYMTFDIPEDGKVDIYHDKLNQSLFDNPNKSVGLSIMEKMGYKVGTGLGKSATTAITEPIKVNLKSGRRGIGGEILPRREYTDKEVSELKTIKTTSNKQRIEMKELQRIMKLCFELSGEYDIFLDNPDIDQVTPLWKPYAENLAFKQQSAKAKSTDENSKFWGKRTPFEDQIDDMEDTLSQLLDYLRNNHQYCWYCGIQYEDKTDLDANCPGKTQDVH